MNPMLAALQKSRAAGPAVPPEAGVAPEGDAAAAGPGDGVLELLKGIDAKLSKLCAAMNLDGPTGEEPVEKDGTEAPPNDDGY